MTAAISAGAAALIGGAATVGSALIGSHASSSAARSQRQAADAATAEQQRQYDQTRADQAPWRAAGGAAVSGISDYLGLPGGTGASSADIQKRIESLPGYQFQVAQGQQAVERNLAARGLLNSGAAAKALTQYGQGMAQNYGQQYLGGLESLAGLGQSSVQATGTAGANAANQIGQNQIYAGNAAASGYVGQANAINSGLQGLAGIAGDWSQRRTIPETPPIAAPYGSPGYNSNIYAPIPVLGGP